VGDRSVVRLRPTPRRQYKADVSHQPETSKRIDELRTALDQIRGRLRQIRGCNGNGVGLSSAALDRLKADAGAPESVRPDDLVVTVHFETRDALRDGKRAADDLLGGVPHEYHIGRYVPL